MLYYVDGNFDKPEIIKYLNNDCLKEILSPMGKNSSFNKRAKFKKELSLLIHRPVISIITSKQVTINGKTDFLIISFQNTSQKSDAVMEQTYMKLNGIKSNLYYQVFFDYSINEVKSIFKAVEKEHGHIGEDINANI